MYVETIQITSYPSTLYRTSVLSTDSQRRQNIATQTPKSATPVPIQSPVSSCVPSRAQPHRYDNMMKKPPADMEEYCESPWYCTT